jgi:hypothetical protein
MMVKHSYFSGLLSTVDVSDTQAESTGNSRQQQQQHQQRGAYEQRDRTEPDSYSTPRYPAFGSSRHVFANTDLRDARVDGNYYSRMTEEDSERQKMMAKQVRTKYTHVYS